MKYRVKISYVSGSNENTKIEENFTYFNKYRDAHIYFKRYNCSRLDQKATIVELQRKRYYWLGGGVIKLLHICYGFDDYTTKLMRWEDNFTTMEIRE